MSGYKNCFINARLRHLKKKISLKILKIPVNFADLRRFL